MNCKKCGTVLNLSDTNCRVCGEPISVETMGQPVEPTVAEQPMAQPAVEPTVVEQPMAQPVAEPTVAEQPMAQPAVEPTVVEQPMAQPVAEPTVAEQPMAQPAVEPTVAEQPMAQPVAEPTVVEQPMAQPVAEPTVAEQPTMGDNMTTSPAQPPKKKSPVFMIIIIVLIIAIVAIGVVIALRMINENADSNTPNDNTNGDNGIVAPSPEPDDAEEENLASIYGYDFVIPENLNYEADEDSITAVASDSSYQFILTISNVTYETTLTDPTNLMRSLIGNTVYTLEDSRIIESGSRDFYVALISVDAIQYYVFATKFNSTYVASGMVAANERSGYTTAFEQISEIVASAKTTSAFGASGSDIEFNDQQLNENFSSDSSVAELEMN